MSKEPKVELSLGGNAARWIHEIQVHLAISELQIIELAIGLMHKKVMERASDQKAETNEPK